MKRILLAGVACLFSFGAAQAATLIPVPQVPGSAPNSTAVFGINDNNAIAGSYSDSAGVEHGFFGTLDGNYTTIADLGVTYTEPRGINNAGIVMGIADDANGQPQPFERYADGSAAFVTLKHSAPMGYGIAGGINANGVFVASGANRNFTKFPGFYGKDAEYKAAIYVSGSVKTFPRGIDSNNNVVGFYLDQQGVNHGFLQKDGGIATIDDPDANGQDTYLYGLNDKGLIAGSWYDSQSGNFHAFIYDSSTGQFTRLEEKQVKHGQFAQTFGLNNDGLVAVTFYAAGGPFIYCPRKPSKCPAGGRDIGPSFHVTGKPVRHSVSRAIAAARDDLRFRGTPR